MDFYTNDAAFDWSRARRVLGWEPKVELRDGLARTLRAHEQHARASTIHSYVWIGKLLAVADAAVDSLAQGSLLLA
jgi:hypothetical protein